jgi:hypothetical protein
LNLSIMVFNILLSISSSWASTFSAFKAYLEISISIVPFLLFEQNHARGESAIRGVLFYLSIAASKNWHFKYGRTSFNNSSKQFRGIVL